MIDDDAPPTYVSAGRAFREEWWRKCRERIMEVGLDWRDVYQQVGVTREIDATPQQIGRIEGMIAMQADINRHEKELADADVAAMSQAPDDATPVRPSWWRRVVFTLTGR